MDKNRLQDSTMIIPSLAEQALSKEIAHKRKENSSTINTNKSQEECKDIHMNKQDLQMLVRNSYIVEKEIVDLREKMDNVISVNKPTTNQKSSWEQKEVIENYIRIISELKEKNELLNNSNENLTKENTKLKDLVCSLSERLSNSEKRFFDKEELEFTQRKEKSTYDLVSKNVKSVKEDTSKSMNSTNTHNMKGSRRLKNGSKGNLFKHINEDTIQGENTGLNPYILETFGKSSEAMNYQEDLDIQENQTEGNELSQTEEIRQENNEVKTNPKNSNATTSKKPLNKVPSESNLNNFTSSQNYSQLEQEQGSYQFGNSVHNPFMNNQNYYNGILSSNNHSLFSKKIISRATPQQQIITPNKQSKFNLVKKINYSNNKDQSYMNQNPQNNSSNYEKYPTNQSTHSYSNLNVMQGGGKAYSKRNLQIVNQSGSNLQENPNNEYSQINYHNTHNSLKQNYIPEVLCDTDISITPELSQQINSLFSSGKYGEAISLWKESSYLPFSSFSMNKSFDLLSLVCKLKDQELNGQDKLIETNNTLQEQNVLKEREVLHLMALSETLKEEISALEASVLERSSEISSFKKKIEEAEGTEKENLYLKYKLKQMELFSSEHINEDEEFDSREEQYYEEDEEGSYQHLYYSNHKNVRIDGRDQYDLVPSYNNRKIY